MYNSYFHIDNITNYFPQIIFLQQSLIFEIHALLNAMYRRDDSTILNID